MAERSRSAARPSTAKRATPANSSGRTAGSPSSPEARISELESERDRLLAELEAARAALVDMERARLQALDRIAWAIDSLHNLVGE